MVSETIQIKHMLYFKILYQSDNMKDATRMKSPTDSITFLSPVVVLLNHVVY